MKAFHFPLESLRTLRKQREHEAQQQYARALVICNGAERLLHLAEEELKAGRIMLIQELGACTTAARIVNLKAWCDVLEVRRHECCTALAEARSKAQQAFGAMTHAVREREALDRFHDKSKQQWQRAFQADEQKMFDELAVQRQPENRLEQSCLN